MSTASLRVVACIERLTDTGRALRSEARENEVRNSLAEALDALVADRESAAHANGEVLTREAEKLNRLLRDDELKALAVAVPGLVGRMADELVFLRRMAARMGCGCYGKDCRAHGAFAGIDHDRFDAIMLARD